MKGSPTSHEALCEWAADIHGEIHSLVTCITVAALTAETEQSVITTAPWPAPPNRENSPAFLFLYASRLLESHCCGWFLERRFYGCPLGLSRPGTAQVFGSQPVNRDYLESPPGRYLVDLASIKVGNSSQIAVNPLENKYLEYITTRARSAPYES